MGRKDIVRRRSREEARGEGGRREEKEGRREKVSSS